MLKFKAAVLVELNKPLEIVELETDCNIGVGQVLVKLKLSGICGSQIGEINGVKGHDNYLPHLLGHEGVGEVIDIGLGVNTVSRGDKVVLHWRQGVGINSSPPKYRWKNQTVNAGWVTTFNEYAIVSENRLTSIPSDTDDITATLMGCAITTGFGAVENTANVKLGDNVVVYGAGGVGLNIIQACALRGANSIYAVDIFDDRLLLAKRFGATEVFNSNKIDVKKYLLSTKCKKEFDVFFDNTGSPEIIRFGYELVSAKGKVALIGVPRFDYETTIHTLPLHFGKIITGSHGGDGNPSFDIPKYLSLFNNGRCSVEGLVTNSYSLENINKAIEDIRSGLATGRVVVEFQ